MRSVFPKRGWIVCAALYSGLLSSAVMAQQAFGTQAQAVNEGLFPGRFESATRGERVLGLWYAYQAPEFGTATFTTCDGTTADTVIELWSAMPADGGEMIASDDDGCGQQSAVATMIQGGDHIFVHVLGYGGESSDFQLTISFWPASEPIEGGLSSAGPDVKYTDCTSSDNHGVVGAIRAYSFGTNTCNIGNQNLLWTNNGTPAIGFNMFRLSDGRLIQIGLGFAKTACCAAAGNGCGMNCNGQGGNVLGSGCLDVYGSGWNASQPRLAPRSVINAYTGTIGAFAGTSGNAIFRRCQVLDTDLTTPNALYFMDGLYVGTDDATAGNRNNNASYKRVTVAAGTRNLTFQGAMQQAVPGIQAWRDHGLGANTPDPTVNIGQVDVPSEGRFWYAFKVTSLPNGNFRYDYAVYNLTSDRSGGSFRVPLPPLATVTNIGFRDVDYHSGEPYSNADWVVDVAADGITWRSPQTFEQNPNSNALRWGTMYNFWFECDRRSTRADATLGLFKPHTPNNVTFTADVPMATTGDLNCDGRVDNFDIDAFVTALGDAEAYAVEYPGCDRMHGDVNGDGAVNNFDINAFVNILPG
ncbi:MAG: hypothetical protein JNG88_01160 [Phycisphaerales bacterium]|nr:hypothetical protein [Phycisphaerales bacterium]